MPIAAEKGAGVKTLAQPKVARVLFDESHSEAWTIRRELAERMQPAHPADSSYTLAAERLAGRDFEIAHPSDPKWEATVSSRPPRLTDAELDAVEEFVRGGGGLIALGETEQE